MNQKLKKEIKDEEDEEDKEPASIRRNRIAEEIQNVYEFVTLRETEQPLFLDPETGMFNDGYTFLKQLIREALDEYYTKASASEIIEMVKVDTYRDTRDFQCPVEWVNLQNGSFNLMTSEFIPRERKPDNTPYKEKIKALKENRKKEMDELRNKNPDPKTGDDARFLESQEEKIDIKFNKLIRKQKDAYALEIQKWKKDQRTKFSKFNFTSMLPLDYNPEASCPKIDEYFHQVQDGDDNVTRLYEIFGYCLWRRYDIKKLFLFVGENDTGKSTVAAILSALLGYGNFSALSLQSIQDDKFEKVKLIDKYANISGELGSAFIKNTQLLKELMGGDWIDPRLMHTQKSRLFINFAKLIFLANKIPQTYEMDNAYYSKVEIIEFLHQFKEGDEGTRSRSELLAELLTESELSGLFNRSVIALRELLKKQKFTKSKTFEETKELYRIKANPFIYYIEEVLGVNNGMDEIEDLDRNLVKQYRQEVFGNFLAMLKQYNLPEWSETLFFTRFNKYLREQFGMDYKAKLDTTNHKWYYPGIYLKKLWADTGSNMSLDDI